MRLIWTAVWSFLLSAMIVYVIGSMSGQEFNVTGTIALAVTFSLVTVILGEGVLKEQSDN
ncbi:YjzD family protein [Alkalibacillus aidingensis]|uniref:YjzD family protein n=1 Tax=Alkalibacillus aidingensis TaxID=2747607 RepID=UPI001660156D|nr:YjzD family protein [Alkalibacillus aidingensis]